MTTNRPPKTERKKLTTHARHESKTHIAGSTELSLKDGSQPLSQTERLVLKEGASGWKLAKDTLLRRKTNNCQLRESLRYVSSLPDYIRPALVSFCSRAVGGMSEATSPCGASLVLFSKAIGIHDDIIDQTKKRGSRLTLFGRFGKERALITSDVLSFEGFVLLWKSLEMGVSLERFELVLNAINNIWFEQAEAEFSETEARGRLNESAERSLEKIRKRAAEFDVIARIGGILGGGTTMEIRNLGKYGRLIGTASLLRDELIDMLELPVLRHRLRNESLPLPLVYAFRNDEARSRILQLTSEKRLGREALMMISKISDEAGGLDYVAGQIQRATEEALSSIRGLEETATLSLLATSIRIQTKEWKQSLAPKSASSPI